MAFVFYEQPVTSTYFVLRPGYEFLAGEMIEYAESAYPTHQHKGLAAAALSRYDQVMRNLGAEIMTGGGNVFYKKIGYQGIHLRLHMKKH